MYTKFVLLSLVAFSFWRFGVKAEGFNPAMDYWRQMSSTLDHKQYKSLHDLVDQNSDTTKSELEEKVGEWAKQNGLENDFKIFTDIQHDYRKVAEKQPTQDDEHTLNDKENLMSKIISELATINEDQTISFKEACRRQNNLVKATPNESVETLGLRNLINPWCES